MVLAEARMLLWEARSVLARAGGGVFFLWVHRVEDAADTLAARLGFRVQRELGVPVKLVGLGEGADDLAPFDAGAFVDALLG